MSRKGYLGAVMKLGQALDRYFPTAASKLLLSLVLIMTGMILLS
jgi:hypothetical protein